MKFLILTLAIASASAAVLPGVPVGQVQAKTGYYPEGGSGSVKAKTGYYPESNSGILKQFSDISVDGTYKYGYETDTGISANEEGIGGQHATGGASWTDPEGVPVVLTYTADENGYKATGSHVPETPEYVARALEYIRTHPGYEEPVYGNSKSVHVAKVATPF